MTVLAAIIVIPAIIVITSITVIIMMIVVVVVALSRRDHVHRAEEPVLLVVDPGGEEERILSGAALAVPEGDAPQSFRVGTVEPAVEDQGVSVGVLKLAEEAAGPQIERADVGTREHTLDL